MMAHGPTSHGNFQESTLARDGMSDGPLGLRVCAPPSVSGPTSASSQRGGWSLGGVFRSNRDTVAMGLRKRKLPNDALDCKNPNCAVMNLLESRDHRRDFDSG